MCYTATVLRTAIGFYDVHVDYIVQVRYICAIVVKAHISHTLGIYMCAICQQ